MIGIACLFTFSCCTPGSTQPTSIHDTVRLPVYIRETPVVYHVCDNMGADTIGFFTQPEPDTIYRAEADGYAIYYYYPKH